MLNLEYLNNDVLLLIFEYLSNNDLKSLCYLSKRFENLIESCIFYKKSLDLLITGHRGKGIAYQKTLHNLSYMKRLEITQNWQNGQYEEFSYFQQHAWYPTQMVLEKKFLYFVRGGQLRAHRRTVKHCLQTKPTWTVGQIKDPEILCTVKKGDTIFAGRSSGDIILITPETRETQKLHQNEFINAVDFTNKIFLTSSNSCTKIWQQEEELGAILLDKIDELDESFYCIRMDYDGRRYIGGKFRDDNKNGLRLINLETKHIETLNSQTSSVYYILWKDENSILTANFDTTLRLFDLRTNRDEIIWDDPYNSSVYSLDYDGLYGVLCGMKYHCRVNLYDIRITNKCVQVFFPSLRNSRSSPVYNVASDASQLFIATGYNLRIFNFDASWATPKDYMNIFVNV